MQSHLWGCQIPHAEVLGGRAVRKLYFLSQWHKYIHAIYHAHTHTYAEIQIHIKTDTCEGLPWIPTGFYYYGSNHKKEKRQSTRPHCSFSWLTSATYNIQEQILYCKDSLSDLLFTYCFPSLIASSKQNPLHLSNDGEDVWGERQLKCSKLMFFFTIKAKVMKRSH